MFITFEGGEGVGKTTIIKIIQKKLVDQNYDLVITREPGGTPKSEEIRKILLNDVNLTNEQRMDLFVLARIDHNQQVITPALKSGKIVISDRYFDSTFVYQGLMTNIEDFKKCVIKNLDAKIQIPNLTFIMDLDPEIAQNRLNKNKRDTNFLDNLPLNYHQKLRQAYLDVVEYKNQYFNEQFQKQEMVVIDANDSIDNIVTKIMSYIIK